MRIGRPTSGDHAPPWVALAVLQARLPHTHCHRRVRAFVLVASGLPSRLPSAAWPTCSSINGVWTGPGKCPAVAVGAAE
jgi:hypothetical protein